MRLFSLDALHGSLLPFDMPSRKDSVSKFLTKSLPYLIVVVPVLAVCGWTLPSVRAFPVIWFQCLVSLDSGFLILVDGLLTLILFWAVSYSLGVLLIYIVRPVERTLRHLLLNRLQG